MKIVVSGPQQSGKSSYIKKLDENALNVEAKGKDEKYYTVGMDLGSLKLNGFDCFLFGTPGLLRFKAMRNIVTEGADGIIFMFDAAHPEKDDSAIIILNSIRKLLPSIPLVFLANKQDIDGARTPEIIRAQNYLPESNTIFPSSTKTGQNIKESITYLVNDIYEEYSSLIQTLRSYETDVKGLGDKLEKNVGEMRDLLNNLELKRFIEVDRLNKTFKVRSGLKHLI